MNILGEQLLLRLYFRSGDRAPHPPSHQRIVTAARSAGLAGATVLRGILGFGHRGESRRHPLAWIEHVPVIVEIVDRPDRLSDFIAGPAGEWLDHGLATVERAHVAAYRAVPADDGCQALAVPDRRRPLLDAAQLKGVAMIQDDALLVRVLIGESDRHEGKPLHEAIVAAARSAGLAGATVLRGIEGYGANSVLHRSDVLAMSGDLPIVIEMVDVRERIEAFLPALDAMVRDGLVTLEYVAVVHRRPTV